MRADRSHPRRSGPAATGFRREEEPADRWRKGGGKPPGAAGDHLAAGATTPRGAPTRERSPEHPGRRSAGCRCGKRQYRCRRRLQRCGSPGQRGLRHRRRRDPHARRPAGRHGRGPRRGGGTMDRARRRIGAARGRRRGARPRAALPCSSSPNHGFGPSSIPADMPGAGCRPAPRGWLRSDRSGPHDGGVPAEARGAAHRRRLGADEGPRPSLDPTSEATAWLATPQSGGTPTRRYGIARPGTRDHRPAVGQGSPRRTGRRGHRRPGLRATRVFCIC
jgi:hypothetical protein